MLNPARLLPSTVQAVNGIPRWFRDMFPDSGAANQSAANNTDYLVWLENHSAIAYPLMGTVVLALMAWGILAALRSNDVDLATRIQMKTDVLDALRMNVAGLSTQELEEQVGRPRAHLVPVLEEMQKDGQVWTTQSGARHTVWHATGVGGTGPQRAARR